MIDVLTDNAATGDKINRYIQSHIAEYGYCSVEDVAKLNGVHAVQISEIGWPLRRVGWFKTPEIAFLKDSDEDFWRIQIEDPVLLDSFSTFKTECLNRPFFVLSPNGTWEQINKGIEPWRPVNVCYHNFDAADAYKIYDIKPIHKEDMIDAMAYSSWITELMTKIEEDGQKKWYKQAYECHFTPKSIEQSADHKTVCVLWKDDTKTIVKLSDNDKDDIDTAFAYALAKKIFVTNTHLKKVVREHLNEHKPKVKKETEDEPAE